MIRIRKNRCYNSGKISGVPFDTVKQKFSAADREIIGLGMVPLNPTCNNVPKHWPWLVHIMVDLISLMKCRFIYMQRDWESSRGARIELKFARLTGKAILFQDER